MFDFHLDNTFRMLSESVNTYPLLVWLLSFESFVLVSFFEKQVVVVFVCVCVAVYCAFFSRRVCVCVSVRLCDCVFFFFFFFSFTCRCVRLYVRARRMEVRFF